MNTTRSVLFGERAAGVYLLTEIYDPDVDGTNISASGKIVPAVGSLIVDNTTGLHNQQYTVTAVDQITYKVTMIPSTFVIDATAQVDRLLSYGNDLYMLYFSDAQLTVRGSNVNLTRLIVDNKLCLFGNHAATYQLVRTAPDGKEFVISRWYKSGDATLDVINGQIESSQLTGVQTAVPMLDTGFDGIKKCDGCYTEVQLHEGDEVRCDIYTAGGLLISQVNLIAKKAHLLNESANHANPIIDMTIQANQMDVDGNLYLYLGQNVSELALFVCLHYSDGHIARIAVDNMHGFVYGLENIVTNTINTDGFTILAKYYLSDSDTCPQYWKTADQVIILDKQYYQLNDSGEYIKVMNPTIDELDTYYEAVVADQHIRFITASTKVKIISTEQDIISKLAVIPVRNRDNVWQLKFLKYRQSRLTEPDNTEYISIIHKTATCTSYVIKNNVMAWTIKGYTAPVYTTKVDAANLALLKHSKIYIDKSLTIPLCEIIDVNTANHTLTTSTFSSFVGNWYNITQQVTVAYTSLINGIQSTIEKKFNIEVRYQDANNVNWLISPINSNIVYGDNTIPHKRPMIRYRPSEGGYYIPGDVFSKTSSQSAVEVFLDNFYSQASPPKLASEAYAPIPTHFIVKDSDGNSLMTAPRAVERFSEPLDLENTGQINGYVGNTLVIEFYRNYTFVKTNDLQVKSNKTYYAATDATLTSYVPVTLEPNTIITSTDKYYEKVLLNNNEILFGVPVDVIQE